MRRRAVDLGAPAGGSWSAGWAPAAWSLTEVAPVPERPVRAGGALRWDILRAVPGGAGRLRAAGAVDSVGIDSWAVDYGLLDARRRAARQPGALP